MTRAQSLMLISGERLILSQALINEGLIEDFSDYNGISKEAVLELIKNKTPLLLHTVSLHKITVIDESRYVVYKYTPIAFDKFKNKEKEYHHPLTKIFK
jgi:hypothetical protein